MIRKTTILMLCFSITAFSQRDSIMATIDLKLGKSGAPGMMLVELPGISSGVVFQRLPHIAYCPASRPGEFSLKKVNPAPGRTATVEHIGLMCSIDSISINTELIYEVYTPLGQLYYLQIVELMGEKVKVRLTSKLSSGVLGKRDIGQGGLASGRTFNANGKRLSEGMKLKGSIGNKKVFYKAK